MNPPTENSVSATLENKNETNESIVITKRKRSNNDGRKQKAKQTKTGEEQPH